MGADEASDLGLTSEGASELERWLAAPPAESQPDGAGELIDVRHQGLRFAVPSTFEDRSLLTLIEPEGGGFRHSVIVAIEPTALDLDAYVARQIAELKESLPGCRVSSPERRATRNDVPYVEVIVRVKVGDDPPVRQVQGFFVANGQAYTVTGSARESSFEAWRIEVFDNVLKGVELE